MAQEMKYAPGFLISVPQLLDPNFYHAVVLLIEHTREGAMGITINHPTGQTIHSIYEQMGRSWPGDQNALLMRGGPVQPEHAWIVHQTGCDVGAIHPIADALFLNTSLEALDDLGRSGVAYRFYVGYAGWGPGQLDREIQEGAWIVSEVDQDLIFNTPFEEIWEKSLKNMGIDPAMLVMGSGVH